MAHIGFYQVTERLYDLFVAQGFASVVLDQQQEIDLKRQTIYPLAFIVPTTGTWPNSQVDVFSFLLTVVDITDLPKGNPRDENLMFYGIDNRQDILHALHIKLRNVVEDFVRGDSFNDGMQISLPVNPEPIIDDLENVLTGWGVLVNITVPSTETIC